MTMQTGQLFNREDFSRVAKATFPGAVIMTGTFPGGAIGLRVKESVAGAVLAEAESVGVGLLSVRYVAAEAQQ